MNCVVYYEIRLIKVNSRTMKFSTDIQTLNDEQLLAEIESIGNRCSQINR